MVGNGPVSHILRYVHKAVEGALVEGPVDNPLDRRLQIIYKEVYIHNSYMVRLPVGGSGRKPAQASPLTQFYSHKILGSTIRHDFRWDSIRAF